MPQCVSGSRGPAVLRPASAKFSLCPLSLEGVQVGRAGPGQEAGAESAHRGGPERTQRGPAQACLFAGVWMRREVTRIGGGGLPTHWTACPHLGRREGSLSGSFESAESSPVLIAFADAQLGTYLGCAWSSGQP